MFKNKFIEKVPCMKLIQKFEVYPFNTLGYPFNTLDIKDNKWIIERLIR